MNKKYNRLCEVDSKVIYNLNKAGFTQEKVGRVVGFTQGAVNKELSRNRGKRGYGTKQSNDLAMDRQRHKKKRSKVIDGVIREEIEARILIKHSPDQISKKLKRGGLKVSHETI